MAGSGRAGVLRAGLAVCVSLGAPVIAPLAWMGVATGALAAPPGAADLPPASEALASFAALEGWVRAGEVRADGPGADPTGATGVSVTLRLSGMVVGRATTMAGEGDAESAGLWAPEGECLRTAARRAIAQAAERTPGERDALREQTVRDALGLVTVDLQVAGRLTPLMGETIDDAALGVNPGVEGVAVRAGSRLRAHMPGLMLSTNAAPAQSLTALCSELGLTRAALGALRTGAGVSVYKFAAHHLAQPAPGEPPRFLFRGGRVVNETDVSAGSLRALADRIAAHLQAHAWPEGRREGVAPDSPGMLGDYEPWADRHEPLVAPPAQQALGAFALARYSTTPGVSPRLAAGSLTLAKRIVRDLEDVGPGEADARLDAPAAAAYFIAFCEANGGADLARGSTSPFADAAAAKAVAAFGEQGWDASLSPPARALIAYAMRSISLIYAPGDERWVSPDAARDTVRSLFRDTPEGKVVGLMPWLGWAAIDLDPGPGALPATAPLLEMRDLLWRHQLTREQVMPDSPDLMGGIVFTAGRTPLPTWQAARPLAFVASMLADPRLTTPDQTAEQMARLSRSLRFLMQLAADEPEGHMYRDRQRALGGVREALWNQRMPVDASAMALLAVCETLRAAERLGANRR